MLRLEEWPVGRLRPDPANPRTHPAEQIDRLAASIAAFGFNNPILADPDGTIVAGEARLRAALQLGRSTVPVVALAHLTPAQRTAFALADNRIALAAGWDEVRLAEVFRTLEAGDVDLGVTGFTTAEIDALLGALDDDPPPEPAPPLPAVPVSRRGDLWRLGDHRVLCGDSTSPEDLGRLLSAPGRVDTVVADLVFTDPPYGMAYEGGRARRAVERPAAVVTDPPYGMKFGAGKQAGSTAKGALVKAHGMILGDDAQGEDLIALVAGALGNAKTMVRPGAAFYVCLTWRTYSAFEAALAACGLSIAACIVWDKGSIGLGHQHYRPRHEFIFYCRGDVWNGGRDEGDVWTLSRGRTEDYVHPTQKPVELAARAVANSTARGDLVLDLFGGSGSTLMACERLGRGARLMELDPRYVDAIVCRWESATGGSARHAGGATFEDIRAQRQ